MDKDKKSGNLVTSIRYKLITGSAWATIGQFSTLLFGFVASIVLTRLLSSRDMGTYFLAMSFIAVMTTIFSLGLPITIVRKVSQYMMLEKIAIVKRIIVVCLVITCVLGLLAYVFVLTLGSWLAEHIFGTVALAILMPQIGLLTFIALVRGFIQESFRGFNDLRFAVLFGGMTTSFLTSSMLVIMWWIKGQSNVEQVIWISIISVGVVAIVALIYIIRKLKTLECNHAIAVPTESILQNIFSVSWAMWLIGILVFLLSSAALWIVSALGSADDVAIYGVAIRLTILVTLFHAISVAVIKPIISELYARNDMIKLEKVVRTVATISFIPAFVTTLVLVFFAKDLLSIVYGNFYGQASQVLLILSVMQLFSIFFGTIGIILLMTGLHYYYLFVAALTGLISVVSAIVLMPHYGIDGVAFAWFSGEIISIFLNVWIIWRKLHIKCYLSLATLAELFTKSGLIHEIMLLRREG